jgi:hypothetical protein
MADDRTGDPLALVASHASDAAAYQDGYQGVRREVTWARGQGRAPTQRQITVALMRTMRVYTTVRGGKVISGQRPEWLHGRVDALRELLRAGTGSLPDDA